MYANESFESKIWLDYTYAINVSSKSDLFYIFRYFYIFINQLWISWKMYGIILLYDISTL